MSRHNIMTGWLLAVLVLVASPVAALETKAVHAVILDHETGAVLFEKAAHETMYPASMTKMMTAHLLFEALEKGEIKLEDTYPVSEEAWRKGGSKMFVQLGSNVSVEDLMRGIVIQSGNDACIVFAEGYAGTEARFAERMTLKAKELGMEHTVFKNATGWPDEEHVTTAYDLAVLARDTVTNYPQYYAVYAEPEYTYHDIRQYNRNLLLARDIGVDGLKTGHTEAAGYGITISGKQGDRRVYVVVSGLTSEKERASEAEALYRFAFAEFNNIRPGEGERVVGQVPLHYGTGDALKVAVAPEAVLSIPTVDTHGAKVELVVDRSLSAPIAKGDQVGALEFSAPGMSVQKVALVAAEDMPRAGLLKRLVTNLRMLTSGS